MEISVSLMLGLTSGQFFLYILLSSFCLMKLILAVKKNVQFIKILFGIILLYIVWELGMQIYQFVQQIKGTSISLLVLICMNIQCIIVETYILFLLSFYWRKTENILHNQIRDSATINTTNLKCQIVCAGIWNVLFSGYFIYFVVAYTQNEDYIEINKNIILFGSQGLTALLYIWSITSQTVNGITLLKTLKNYEALTQIPLNKQKFVLIVWMTSVINLARLVFLVFITFLFFVNDQGWLPLFIYTFTALFPIAFYLLGFTFNESDEFNDMDITGKKRISERSSKHSTQLSASY